MQYRLHDKYKPYQSVERGYYKVGDRNIHFRSKMEANYALYLEYLKNKGEIIAWDYEAETFIFEKILFGVRSYKPDFRVTRNNGSVEYHECKGYMDTKSRTKLKRMRIYYPNVKIILVNSADYYALKKWSKLLKFY